MTTITTSFDDAAAQTSVSLPSQYKKDAILETTDGTGAPTETWTLYGLWPMETNWGELDYTSNDVLLIEVNCRFDKAVMTKS